MLDMSIVGLGNLTEYQLLVLFGNYHSLGLVEGTSLTPNHIVDTEDRLLYPAYYKTYIQVPLNNFIESYALWDMAKISVNIRRFGANLLDSQYSFQKIEDEKSEIKETITMTSNSLFVLDATIDNSVNRTSSIPKLDRITELEKLKKIPDSLKRFKVIRHEGFALSDGVMCGNYKMIYKVVPNRDVSIHHGVMFAKFTEIMDICEFEFLYGENNIGLPKVLASFIHIVDRETYYYHNCFAEDEIECRMILRIEKCEERHLTGKKNEFSSYWLHENFELYNKKTRDILVISKATKIINLPIMALDLEDDINRIMIQKDFKNF